MVPRIKVLNDKELKEIDRASRELLWDVGVIVSNEEALELYKKAGAQVDFNQKLVRIPPHIIDETLMKCSPSIKLYGRDGVSPLIIGGMHTYFGTTGFATNILDYETGKYRPSLYQDLIKSIRLADVLDLPDYILVNIGATDIPAKVIDLYEFKAALTNTKKHIQAQAQGKENLWKIISMAKEVAGNPETLKDRPFFSILVTLTSPLYLRSDSAELLIEGAREGLPLFIESGPMSGATSPATMASTIITANAELLSSFVLAKHVNSTVPLIYASWARILDMKTGTVSVGGPEFGLLRIATTQMAKFYNLPSGGGGTLTDSKLNDVQLGAEILSTTLLPALAGTNMIQGMGLLAGMNAVSFETLVIANEIIGYVKRILQGIQVNDATTDLSIFKEVGPRGTFIDTNHTFEYFRKEMWIPKLINRGGALSEGLDPELNSFGAHAKKAIVKALEKYTPPSLPEGINSRLKAIING